MNSIGTGNCPREEMEDDAYQITNRKCKCYHWDAECPHFESMRKTERIDVRWTSTDGTSSDCQRNPLARVGRLPQKDTASGSVATAKDNNMEWDSSWIGPESSRSSAAHQFPAELLQSASLPSQKTSRWFRHMQRRQRMTTILRNNSTNSWRAPLKKFYSKERPPHHTRRLNKI